MRPFALAGVALLTACRPDIERDVPCARGGDLSCPTGFHCAESQYCAPGERPRLRFNSPSSTAPLTGSQPVSVEVVGVEDIGAVSLHVGSPDMPDWELPAKQVKSPSGTHIEGSLPSWWLTSGRYTLTARASTAATPLLTGQAVQDMEVLHPTSSMTVNPSSVNWVDNVATLSGEVASIAPMSQWVLYWQRRPATESPRQVRIDPELQDQHDPSGTMRSLFTVHWNAADVESGPWQLTIRATDIMGTSLSGDIVLLRP